MAALTAAQVFESLIPAPEERAQIRSNDVSYDYQALWNRAEVWCDNSTRRAALRFIDTKELPSAVQQALQVAQQNHQPTQFRIQTSSADTSSLREFVSSNPPLSLDVDNEFKLLSHFIEAGAEEGRYKVLSGPSLLVAIALEPSRNSVALCESGTEFALSFSVRSEIVPLVIKWIRETSSGGVSAAVTALAEINKWHSEMFGRHAFYQPLDSPSKQLDRIKIALTTLQYQGYVLAPLDVFRSRLRAETFIHSDTFICRGEYEWRTYFREVRVGDIVSALPAYDKESCGWDFRDRGSEYVYEMAQAILDGRFIAFRPPTYRDFWNNPDIVLVKRGDQFGITVNGRHRVAALKGIDSDLRVWAQVYEPLM